MEYLTIRNSGKLIIYDQLEDGRGIRNLRRFLKEMAVTYAKKCCSYTDVVGELPFTYRERQINSIMVPAIMAHADAALMEQPITRKSKKGLSHGWLDYWIIYKSSVFLIEVKHAWKAWDIDTVRQRTQDQWQKAAEQLIQIKKDEVEGLAISRTAVKVALMVVPFYKSSTDVNKLNEFIVSIEEAEKKFMKLHSGFNPEPEWSCLWYLP